MKCKTSSTKRGHFTQVSSLKSIMFVECVGRAILFALHYLQFYLTLLNLLVNLLFQLLAFFHIGAVNGINTRHLINCFCEIMPTRRRGIFQITAALI